MLTNDCDDPMYVCTKITKTDIFWCVLIRCKYVGVQTRWYENYDSDASKSQSSPTSYQDLFLFADDVAYGKKLICTVQWENLTVRFYNFISRPILRCSNNQSNCQKVVFCLSFEDFWPIALKNSVSSKLR